jgi:hypothetical protein
MLRALALTLGLISVAGCWGPSAGESPTGPVSVALVADGSGGHFVRVSGWSAAQLTSIAGARLTPEAWTRLIALRVDSGTRVAVAARYSVTAYGVDVVPVYPLDSGREYLVEVGSAPSVITRLTVPPAVPAAPTLVSAISPSASVWPENTLRFYLHFSAPMSGTSAVSHVRLVDDKGVEIPDVLLDVDVDLWNTDYTRRTVFFDPGRVKRGIRPNRELGRAMVAGRRYAIVVATTWKDATGAPLAREFRHAFTAGPAVEAAIDPAGWTIGRVTPGTLSPLTVLFPLGLDEGLLHRAVGVAGGDGRSLDGHIGLTNNERTWTFTPAQPWPAGALSLVVLTLLEDPAGNRVGEAFEFEMFGNPPPATERVTLPIPGGGP